MGCASVRECPPEARRVRWRPLRAVGGAPCSIPRECGLVPAMPRSSRTRDREAVRRPAPRDVCGARRTSRDVSARIERAEVVVVLGSFWVLCVLAVDDLDAAGCEALEVLGRLRLRGGRPPPPNENDEQLVASVARTMVPTTVLRLATSSLIVARTATQEPSDGQPAPVGQRPGMSPETRVPMLVRHSEGDLVFRD